MPLARVNSAFLLLLLLILFFSSCDEKKLEVLQLEYQHNLYFDVKNNNKYESLSLFLHFDNNTDLNSIDRIYVINDLGRLYWELSSANWVVKTVQNEIWLGSNNLTPPLGEEIARKSYRVVVSDLGGVRREHDFFLNTPKDALALAQFPVLEKKSGTLSLQSGSKPVFLWIYGADDRLIQTIPLESGGEKDSITQAIGNMDPSRYFKIYAFDKRLGCGLISGPWR